MVPVTTQVSLTFDNGTVGQYNLGYLQALRPHGAHATFFVNTGNVGVSANVMTWAQLTALDGLSPDELVEDRYRRFRALGSFVA